MKKFIVFAAAAAVALSACTKNDPQVDGSGTGNGTGEYHTVREFTTLAFKRAGIELKWKGEGLDEKGIDIATGRILVEVDPKFFRPAEVEQLLGDPTKAKEKLGWNPRKTSFQELINIMVDSDLELIKNQK